MRNDEENDFLAKVFLVFMAMFVGVTGGYIMLLGTITYSAPTYDLMAGLLSLDTYGAILIGAGVLYIYAALNEGRRRSVGLLIAGFFGGTLFALYATAAFEGTDNVMIPLRYAITAGFNYILAGVGGVALWKRNH